ncbi:hypothetical protein D9756_009105 [Leucocoprinus leucothites]|uniref:Aminoglycoside phosphotransferase domain-containing protein n=1 Tax=Leucocoprinus leucothites TaxID=201217 RepID=A0A8H5CY32_9AGAR|nr:hypothetical protein D9756_009105 [Leucoagaricus leucothites]
MSSYGATHGSHLYFISLFAMDNPPYWDHHGVKHLDWPPPPDSWKDWTVGDDLTPEQEHKIRKAEELLGSPVQQSSLFAASVNSTMRIILADERNVIFRQVPFVADKYSHDHSIDANLVRDWRRRKLDVEISVLRFLENTTVPVPKIIASSVCNNAGYLVLDILPGKDALKIYGLLSDSAKDNAVMSYALIALEIFRLNVPNKIGSIGSPNARGEDVVPRLVFTTQDSFHVVLNTLEEFVDHFIDGYVARRKASTSVDLTPESHHGARERALLILEQCRKTLLEVCYGLDSPFLRHPALRHEDLRAANVLLDQQTGSVTGIIDWEYHSIVPAVLAAEYPPWLSYTGPNDPRFGSDGSAYCCSPQESAYYQDMYASIVKDKDPEYYECLVKGKKLRDAINWLQYYQPYDEECSDTAQWMSMTFETKGDITIF